MLESIELPDPFGVTTRHPMVDFIGWNTRPTDLGYWVAMPVDWPRQSHGRVTEKLKCVMHQEVCRTKQLSGQIRGTVADKCGATTIKEHRSLEACSKAIKRIFPIALAKTRFKRRGGSLSCLLKSPEHFSQFHGLQSTHIPTEPANRTGSGTHTARR